MAQNRNKALGQCATCDNQAAPWYQCSSCRLTNKIRRITKRAARVGGVNIRKCDQDARKNRYSIASWDAIETLEWRPDPSADDRRLLPRVGKIPVDLLATLTNILRDQIDGLTEEEICLAWAKLKAERSSSLVADISCIIAAQRKRERRSAK